MKQTFYAYLVAAFDDGTNKANYLYMFQGVGSIIEFPVSAFWRNHTYCVTPPTATVSITAYARTGVTGTPPAFADRSVQIGADGTMTFVDEDETPAYVELRVDIVSAEDHDYVTQYLVSHHNSLQVAIWVNDGAGITLDANGGYPLDFGATGDYIKVGFAFRLAYLTDVGYVLPTMAFSIADMDLLTRVYNGQLIEAGVKGLIATIEVGALRSFEGLVAQAINHFRGSPVLGIDLPSSVHQVRVTDPTDLLMGE